MTKITKLTMLFVFIFSSVSFAQLSQRENDPATYKIGTRPIAGNMGFYVGLDAKTVGDLFKKKEDQENKLNTKTTFPLVNVKYYIDNNTVFRVGLSINKDKTVFKGEEASDTSGNESVESKSKTVTSEYLLIPAIEKHFNTNNFLDAYVGAQALIGFVKDRKDTSNVLANNDSYKMTSKGNSPVYGLGGFIGLQAFIADLPLAVGVEYGIVGKGYLSNKYKTETETTVGGNTTTVTSTNAANNDNYDGLYQKGSSREFEISNMVRVTVNYFFTK